MMSKKRCKAITYAGKRCGYNAILDEYCAKHYEMYVVKGKQQKLKQETLPKFIFPKSLKMKRRKFSKYRW